MKPIRIVIIWVATGLLTPAVLALGAAQFGLLRGTPPTDLGVHDGRLKPPSTSPNSVSSQADLWPDHRMHHYASVAPLTVPGDPATVMARVKAVVQAMPGAAIVKAEGDYLYAEFTSPLMKFTDDVEFWFDRAAGVVQVRSASRLGHGDLGANRKRVEALRALLTAS